MTIKDKFYSLWSYVKNDKLEKIKDKVVESKEKILVYSIILGVCLLTLKLFDITTLLYVFIILTSLASLIYIKGAEACKNGLINYLPIQIRNVIMKRSIFDILMDIWYLPTISEYIKLLIKPVLYKMTPQEATKLLEDFDPSTRSFFLTKGIVNLFPTKVKNVLIPPIEAERKNVTNSKNMILMSEENVSDSTRDENNLINEKNVNFLLNEQNSHDESVKDTKETGLIKYQNKISQPKSEIKQRKTSRHSSIISRVNNNFDSNNIILEERLLSPKLNIYDFYEKEFPLISTEETAPIAIIHKRKELEPLKCDEIIEVKPLHTDDDYRYYETNEGQGKVIYKTIVLESSEKMRNKRKVSNTVPIVDIREFCWDNINEYYNRVAKQALKGNNEEIENTSFIQMFYHKVQQHLMSKIDYNKLSKAFVIFILTFLIQMIISKKARRWSVSFLQSLFFMATSLGAGGTLYFLLKKIK